ISSIHWQSIDIYILSLRDALPILSSVNGVPIHYPLHRSGDDCGIEVLARCDSANDFLHSIGNREVWFAPDAYASHFPASGHVVSWGLPEVLKLDTYIWREVRFGVPIGETYRGFGNRQVGSELAAGSFASDIDRFFRRFSGAPSGNGRPGGNDYGSYQPNDTESACNRLPVSDL